MRTKSSKYYNDAWIRPTKTLVESLWPYSGEVSCNLWNASLRIVYSHLMFCNVTLGNQRLTGTSLKPCISWRSSAMRIRTSPQPFVPQSQVCQLQALSAQCLPWAEFFLFIPVHHHHDHDDNGRLRLIYTIIVIITMIIYRMILR